MSLNVSDAVFLSWSLSVEISLHVRLIVEPPCSHKLFKQRDEKVHMRLYHWTKVYLSCRKLNFMVVQRSKTNRRKGNQDDPLSAQDRHALVPFANHVRCENNIVGKSNFTVSDI